MEVETGVGGSLNFLAALRLFREGMRSVSPVDVVDPPEGFESWILGVGGGDKLPSSIFFNDSLPVSGYWCGKLFNHVIGHCDHKMPFRAKFTPNFCTHKLQLKN